MLMRGSVYLGNLWDNYQVERTIDPSHPAFMMPFILCCIMSRKTCDARYLAID